MNCNCHCHHAHPQGAQCRCIKNCEHCHPENFPGRLQENAGGFKECDKCAAQPGSPLLCLDCRLRRNWLEGEKDDMYYDIKNFEQLNGSQATTYLLYILNKANERSFDKGYFQGNKDAND